MQTNISIVIFKNLLVNVFNFLKMKIVSYVTIPFNVTSLRASMPWDPGMGRQCFEKTEYVVPALFLNSVMYTYLIQ